MQEENSKKVYLIEDPSTLTFSSSIDYLIEKYKLKFSAGHKSKGPFYVKSVCGLFKLILRTMMKYKEKHKNLYKKICVLDKPFENNTSKPEEIKITVRSSKYNRTISIKDLLKKI